MAINVPIISSWDGRGVQKAIRDFKKLEGGSAKSAFALLNTDAAVRKGIASFAKFSAIGAGVAGIIGGKFVSAAYESQKVMKQTEAIIKATGGSANVTADYVAKLSERLAMQVGVDDELIQSGANLLLTFKQIQNVAGEGNQIFDRAVQASLDLGNVFGSVDKAALQLGKALADPMRGITALRRSGINFTEQQRDQIKTLVQSGKTLEAQKIILAEVESQVGGTAAATATGFDKMKVAVENVQERLGALLIPAVERFSDFVNNNVVPVLNNFADVIGERGVGAGLQYLFGKIVDGIWQMGALGKAILVAVGAFGALRVAAVSYTATMTALNVVTTLSNGALAQLITRLGQAKIAMLAAGGVTALLSVAAIAYTAYASEKSKAVDRTRDLVNALLMENAAQSETFQNLVKNNPQFKIMVASLGDVGLTMQDVTQYTRDGTGRFAKFVEALNLIPATASAGVAQLDAYANAVGILAGAQSSAGGEIAFGLSQLAAVARGARAETIATNDAMALLGRTGVTFGNSMSGAGSAVETAAQKLEKARQKFRDWKNQAESVVSQQRSLTDATKETNRAYTDLTSATAKVVAAQAKLNQIASGYGSNSDQATDAREELTRAEREAERAGYDLERANFAVADAEKALVQAQRSGNPQSIREAEIALAEARLSVRDAQDAVRVATENVTTAQTRLNETINGASTSSQTYKDALAELKTAQDEELQAIERVNAAKIREFEITKRLTQAQLLLSKAKGQLTKKQRRKAEKELRELQQLPDLVTTPPSQISGVPSIDLSGMGLGNIPAMAEGGIVRRATLALIGERGPEAVVPLNNNAAMGGDVYHIHINSKIADETLPDLLVAELRKFNRRSGAINIQVA